MMPFNVIELYQRMFDLCVIKTLTDNSLSLQKPTTKTQPYNGRKPQKMLTKRGNCNKCL